MEAKYGKTGTSHYDIPVVPENQPPFFIRSTYGAGLRYLL